MCLKKHLEKYQSSPAYHAAVIVSLELKEVAKHTGGKTSNIYVRKKSQIVRTGFSKADAQVVWEDGPEDWATDFIMKEETGAVCIAENGYTLSFYDK